jgi:trichohyalin
MNDQEKDFLEDTEIEENVKPTKKKLSEQKLQHLANIRVKALEKKKEMKQITEKANKLKEIESLKEMKKLQKEQLAKKYDEMIEKQKVEEDKPKVEEDKPKEEIVKKEPKEEEVKPKVEEVKPIKKKKIIKKLYIMKLHHLILMMPMKLNM